MIDETHEEMTNEEWIKGWEQKIEEILGFEKTQSPESALDMQRHIEGIEAEAEAEGTPIPKHSHRFAPDNLWPKNGAGE